MRRSEIKKECASWRRRKEENEIFLGVYFSSFTVVDTQCQFTANSALIGPNTHSPSLPLRPHQQHTHLHTRTRTTTTTTTITTTTTTTSVLHDTIHFSHSWHWTFSSCCTFICQNLFMKTVAIFFVFWELWWKETAQTNTHSIIKYYCTRIEIQLGYPLLYLMHKQTHGLIDRSWSTMALYEARALFFFSLTHKRVGQYKYQEMIMTLGRIWSPPLSIWRSSLHDHVSIRCVWIRMSGLQIYFTADDQILVAKKYCPLGPRKYLVWVHY